MRVPTLAGMLLASPCLAWAGPALAQSAPLEIACPAEAGRRCGIGLVEGGGEGGRVLALRADGAGWAGRRVALATGGGGGPYALRPYAGKVVVFEHEGPAEPPPDAAGELGGVTLLYVIAPVAPAGGGGGG